MALLLLAFCDPNLVRENRRPLKDIVAVVVDRSESQSIGERPEQTDKARDELEARLRALGDVDLRVVETSREESETEGTKLFAALRGALPMRLPTGSGARSLSPTATCTTFRSLRQRLASMRRCMH